MRTFTAVIERCPDTGLFVGYVPGFPGAHSQGESLDELQENLAEVIRMTELPVGTALPYLDEAESFQACYHLLRFQHR